MGKSEPGIYEKEIMRMLDECAEQLLCLSRNLVTLKNNNSLYYREISKYHNLVQRIHDLLVAELATLIAEGK